MAVFNNLNGKLSEVNEKPFILEKEIQKIFEDNLGQILGLELIKSEFSVKDRRIDTLAYDEENKAFIIIEYKRDKNTTVVEQGIAYLNLMLENKADFIVEYNYNRNKALKREEIEWSETRVLFVSTSFTDNQIQSTNFKDLPIELWEVKRFENNIIVIKPIGKSASAPSIKPFSTNNTALKRVTDEIKIYSEEYHLRKANDATKELYEKFRNELLNLSNNIVIEPKKVYLAFRKEGNNIAYFVIQNKSIKIIIFGKGRLNDPKKITEDATKERWGNGTYKTTVSNDSELDYIMWLIKQVIQ